MHLQSQGTQAERNYKLSTTSLALSRLPGPLLSWNGSPSGPVVLHNSLVAHEISSEPHLMQSIQVNILQ